MQNMFMQGEISGRSLVNMSCIWSPKATFDYRGVLKYTPSIVNYKQILTFASMTASTDWRS